MAKGTIRRSPFFGATWNEKCQRRIVEGGDERRTTTSPAPACRDPSAETLEEAEDDEEELEEEELDEEDDEEELDEDDE